MSSLLIHGSGEVPLDSRVGGEPWFGFSHINSQRFHLSEIAMAQPLMLTAGRDTACPASLTPAGERQRHCEGSSATAQRRPSPVGPGARDTLCCMGCQVRSI